MAWAYVLVTEVIGMVTFWIYIFCASIFGVNPEFGA